MAGGNEAQRSNRFNLPNNMAFTFIIRMFRQFHAVTALRFVHACHNEKLTMRVGNPFSEGSRRLSIFN
jgi:hypothetical protein